MTSGTLGTDAGDRKLLVWDLFLLVLIFIPMSSKLGHVSSIRLCEDCLLLLCWIVYWVMRKLWSLLSFSQCTHCPRRSSVKNSSSDPSAPRFWLECHPWKRQGCQSLGFLHISAEEKLKVFYFLKPGIALPFTSQMQLLETSKICWKQRIFSALLPLCSQLSLFQRWLPASVRWRGCPESWVLKLFLLGSWQKTGFFRHSVREGDSRNTEHTCVCVYTPHLLHPPCTCLNFLPHETQGLISSLLQTSQFRLSFWCHFTWSCLKDRWIWFVQTGRKH